MTSETGTTPLVIRQAAAPALLDHGPDGDALHSPRWRHMERTEVEALIGGPVGVPAEGSY